MNKCLLEIWNSEKKESNWVQGEIVGECDGDVNEDFKRIDVKTKNGVFYGCHPDCVKAL